MLDTAATAAEKHFSGPLYPGVVGEYLVLLLHFLVVWNMTYRRHWIYLNVSMHACKNSQLHARQHIIFMFVLTLGWGLGLYRRSGGTNDSPTFATFICHLIIPFLDEQVCIGG